MPREDCLRLPTQHLHVAILLIMNYLYNISINQCAVIENGWDLDLADLAIFQVFHIFGNAPKTIRVKIDGSDFFMITAKKIREELPILGIKTDKQIKNRIAKLVSCKLLDERIVEELGAGRKSYCFGENYEKLFSTSEKKFTQGRKNISDDPEKNFHDTRKKISTKDYTIEDNTKDYTDNPPLISPQGENTAQALSENLKTDCKVPATRMQLCPFDSAEFRDAWRMLLQQPKWQKKTINAVRMSAKKLKRYDEAFARGIVELAIANDWQGVVFPDTDKKYLEWKKGATMAGMPTPKRKTVVELFAEREKKLAEEAARKAAEQSRDNLPLC